MLKAAIVAVLAALAIILAPTASADVVEVCALVTVSDGYSLNYEYVCDYYWVDPAW